jgi:DNA mismatch repair protein MutL
MPARKKFLKSKRTELFHIEETIKNYCLANYRLGITYAVNNTTLFNLAPGEEILEDRVNLFYSRNSSETLIPISNMPGSPADSVISVKGFLLSPEHSFGASSKLRLFVNGRAVKDRMMAHAVAEGLSGFLMKGRSAAGVLFVSLPHDAVDVNVHPTKQEIRFHHPNTIHQQIVSAIRSVMASFQHQSKQSIFGSADDTVTQEPERVISHQSKMTGQASIDLPWNKLFESPREADLETNEYRISDNDKNLASGMPSIAEPEAVFQQTAISGDHAPDSLTPIGQFHDLYLLCEARQGDDSFLVVIDQHAAHERILFEDLKQKFASKKMASQDLLFPKMLELTPESAEILEKNKDTIKDFGITVEEFGGENFIIKSVPSIVSHLDPEEILTGILEHFSGPAAGTGEGRKRKDATRLDDILSTMACKAAVKAGQSLKPLEVEELLKLMKDSSAFTHCPHGRPVVRMFSTLEIKKWFHRT